MDSWVNITASWYVKLMMMKPHRWHESAMGIRWKVKRGVAYHLQKPSALLRGESDQMRSQTVPHLLRGERAVSHLVKPKEVCLS